MEKRAEEIITAARKYASCKDWFKILVNPVYSCYAGSEFYGYEKEIYLKVPEQNSKILFYSKCGYRIEEVLK